MCVYTHIVFSPFEHFGFCLCYLFEIATHYWMFWGFVVSLSISVWEVSTGVLFLSLCSTGSEQVLGLSRYSRTELVLQPLLKHLQGDVCLQ